MFGGGKGPMGGGGGMIRAASRAMTRAGVGNLQEPFSSSSSSSSSSANINNTASHGSSGSAASKKTQKPNSRGSSGMKLSTCGSPLNHPVPASFGVTGFGGSVFGYDEFEWVSVDDVNDDEFSLGPVPSVDEVHDAVSALQQVFETNSYSHLVRDRFESNVNKIDSDGIPSLVETVHRVSSVGSELDWIEPSVQVLNPRTLQSHGFDHVYDAFDLLRTEPSVQRMVISLSSDKAIWDAVMNNEVVQEIRESYNAGLSEEDKDSTLGSDEISAGSDSASEFIKWVFNSTKAKIMEVFEQITKLVSELFKIPDDEKNKNGTSNPFDEKVRTSVMLSIVVLLVVVVTRTSRA